MLFAGGVIFVIFDLTIIKIVVVVVVVVVGSRKIKRGLETPISLEGAGKRHLNVHFSFFHKPLKNSPEKGGGGLPAPPLKPRMVSVCKYYCVYFLSLNIILLSVDTTKIALLFFNLFLYFIRYHFVG